MAQAYSAYKRREMKSDTRFRSMIYALSSLAGIVKAEKELELEARVLALEESLGVNPMAGSVVQ